MLASVPVDPAVAGGNLCPKRTARNPITRLRVDRFPRGPLWRLPHRLRGRSWRDLRNTPGHLSTAGPLALLERQVEVRAVRTALPWMMALCRVG
jgi:hypothetical protein